VKKGTVYFDELPMPYNQAAKIAGQKKDRSNFPAFAMRTHFATIMGFRFFPVAAMRSNQIRFTL